MKRFIIIPGDESLAYEFLRSKGKESAKDTVARALAEGLVTAEDEVLKSAVIQEPEVLDPDKTSSDEEDPAAYKARVEGAKAYWDASLGKKLPRQVGIIDPSGEVPTEKIATLPSTGGGYERIA